MSIYDEADATDEPCETCGEEEHCFIEEDTGDSICPSCFLDKYED